MNGLALCQHQLQPPFVLLLSGYGKSMVKLVMVAPAGQFFTRSRRIALFFWFPYYCACSRGRLYRQKEKRKPTVHRRRLVRQTPLFLACCSLHPCSYAMHYSRYPVLRNAKVPLPLPFLRSKTRTQLGCLTNSADERHANGEGRQRVEPDIVPCP